MRVVIKGRAKTIRLSGRNYDINAVVQKHTAFESFGALLDAPNNYRPSLYLAGKSEKAKREIVFLALSYNEAQGRRGDARRVYAGDWAVPSEGLQEAA